MRDQSTFVRRAPALALCASLGACSSSSGSRGSGSEEPAPVAGDGPFKALAVAAHAPETFSQPRAGVPLEGGAVAFVAIEEAGPDVEPSGPRSAVFLQPPPTSSGKALAPRVLYAGDALVSPLDIEASADGTMLFVADYAGGSLGLGAIVRLTRDGELAGFAAEGWSPRGVTLGPDERLYFSGVEPESGAPGVFRLSGDAVEPVFVGPPLVDPSGIAVFRDGRVLVADTRLFDGGALLGDVTASEAGVVLLDAGQASVFASGFASGFPAGIALTLDESTLIVSGQGPDRADTVYLVDVSAPGEPPAALRDVFSVEHDSSAGLKRAHQTNTFIWASLALDRGTVFRIDG